MRPPPLTLHPRRRRPPNRPQSRSQPRAHREARAPTRAPRRTARPPFVRPNVRLRRGREGGSPSTRPPLSSDGPTDPAAARSPDERDRPTDPTAARRSPTDGCPGGARDPFGSRWSATDECLDPTSASRPGGPTSRPGGAGGGFPGSRPGAPTTGAPGGPNRGGPPQSRDRRSARFAAQGHASSSSQRRRARADTDDHVAAEYSAGARR